MTNQKKFNLYLVSIVVSLTVLIYICDEISANDYKQTEADPMVQKFGSDLSIQTATRNKSTLPQIPVSFRLIRDFGPSQTEKSSQKVLYEAKDKKTKLGDDGNENDDDDENDEDGDKDDKPTKQATNSSKLFRPIAQGALDEPRIIKGLGIGSGLIG